MKKNWIKIIVAALFICANIVTFLFAQGKVKIVEKIVTVYKEDDTKQDKLPVSSGEVPKPAGLAKVGITKENDYDFNDSDYLTDENRDTVYDAVDDEEVQDLNPEEELFVKDETANEPIESENAARAGIRYFNGDRENRHNPSESPYFPDMPSMPGEPRGTYLADEGIPIPQLPLFDTDFEVDADFGGYEDILLPRLPDIG